MAETNCGFGDGDTLRAIGPCIAVRIGFDREYVSGATPHPNIPPSMWTALIDTGATGSCIDDAVARALRLPIADREEWSGIGGPTPVNIYLAQMEFPSLGGFLYGRFAGVHLSASNQPHRALVGRDFLRNFRMAYDGRSGDVILSDS
jgi:predicted aspartyl protease